jgi:FtsH-binding integral membrane protein
MQPIGILGVSPPTLLTSLFKTHDISPDVQQHLARVFGLVACGVGIASFGCYLGVFSGITNGLALVLGAFGALALLFCALSTDRSLASRPRRTALFAAFAAAEGLALAPIARALSARSPYLLFEVLFLSGAVFSAFALAALVSRRRAYVAFYGTLGSVASMLLMISLINVFFVRSASLQTIELGIGLLVAVAFTAVHTQIIVERASAGVGEPDALADASQLFLDLVKIFIRFAIIMLRKGERGEGGGGGGGGGSVESIVSNTVGKVVGGSSRDDL